MVAARHRADRRGAPGRPGPSRPGRTTSTTRRASSSCSVAGSGSRRPAFTPIVDDPNLHPGRAARVVAGGAIVGRLGELHPAVVDALDLRAERIVVGEFAVAGLAGGQPSPYRVAAPSRQPTVERDLAVIVPVDASRRRRSRRPSGATAGRSCAA